jgi:hypothetical protein
MVFEPWLSRMLMYILFLVDMGAMGITSSSGRPEGLQGPDVRNLLMILALVT